MGARPGLSRFEPAAAGGVVVPMGGGPESPAARRLMIERLQGDGIRDPQVLAAMASVTRHEFIEPALRGRAYQDVALPIGHGQTISKPSSVARMIELIAAPIAPEDRRFARVLEIGTGCGYQAAVLAEIFGEVVTIERIEALHALALEHLQPLPSRRRIRLVHGDGHLGLPGSAPFHAIVLAAALDGVLPEALLRLLRPGARLSAPMSLHGGQRLIIVDRTGPDDWQLAELDTVRFVPMLGGVS
ncbi:MAG: protein-L-isoaspartate O-methyltransferase [Burkholderiaceae bacterium]